MAFTVHTLTNDGATLIASATVSTKLRIIGCSLTRNQYSLQAAQQLKMSDLPYDAPATTNITASAIDNRVEVRATFLRSQGDTCGGNWYSMVLVGRLGSQAPKTIAVIVSDSEFYIPETDSSISDVSVIFSLGFNININTILVPTETIYTLNSAFETLKGIAVTTHNFSDPSVGDDQDIKGTKYFEKAIGSDNGLETSEFTINGNDIIVRSSLFNEGGVSFEHIIAEVNDTTNGLYTGLYLERDDVDEFYLKSNADHVSLPGLVSDRTGFYYIGCIAMIAIKSPVAPNPSRYEVGSTIQYQNGVLEIYAASWNPSTNRFDIATVVRNGNEVNIDLQGMKFKLMTQCRLVQMGTTICLAMRVE